LKTPLGFNDWRFQDIEPWGRLPPIPELAKGDSPGLTTDINQRDGSMKESEKTNRAEVRQELF
jgi:hypothetical protein